MLGWFFSPFILKLLQIGLPTLTGSVNSKVAMYSYNGLLLISISNSKWTTAFTDKVLWQDVCVAMYMWKQQ